MKSLKYATVIGLAVGGSCWLEVSAQSPPPPAPNRPADGEITRVPGENPEAGAASEAPLEKLAWMVGEWVDEDEASKVETSVAWTKNRKFLRRMFRVTPREGEPHQGLQIIGWDPSEKTIRSWTYDADGGFGEERWKQSGDRWVIRTTYTLPDGERASATNIMKRLDDDRFTFRSVNRTIAGALQPDIDEVTVVRRSGEAEAPLTDAQTAPTGTTEPATTTAPESPEPEKKP